MLQLAASAHARILGHAYQGLPDEACGLLVGSLAKARADSFEPCVNEAASAKLYSIGGRDFMRIDRAAEAAGAEIIGVVHSHTHTQPYPSPTDVRQAPDPAWHYVIVSLRLAEPEVRSFRIVDGEITEERIVLF